METSNFIVLYTSREGSSPIVQNLSYAPDVAVPVFEELDRHWMQKFYPGQHDPIAEVDRVLTERVYGREHDYGHRAYVTHHEDPQAASSVGFKWRPHGKLWRLPRVLKKHKVKVFLLCRRDLMEVVTSYYVSRVMVRDKSVPDVNSAHTQFKMANRTEAESAAIEELIRNYTAKLNLWHWYALMAHRVWKVARLRMLLLYLKLSGVPTDLIYYEDFRTNPPEMLGRMRRSIGLPFTPPQADGAAQMPQALKPAVKQGHRNRVKNYKLVLYLPPTWILQGLYRLVTWKPGVSG